MATINATLSGVLHQLRRRMQSHSNDSDSDLLVRFVQSRDEAAFEEILRRHGPMVLAVCRRVLGTTPDADDAFQASFLVFVRKAGAIRRTDLLANWLCAVAYRAARQARRRRFHIGSRERQIGQLPQPAYDGLPPDDWRPLFDAAFQRLPAKYREPMILCELQGFSRADAARRLGLNEGTLSCRLARGREMLKRKLGPGFVLGATALASAAVPDALVAAAVQLPVRGVAAPFSVLQLAEGVTKMMFASRLKYGLILAAIALATGVGWRVTGPNASATPADRNPPAISATADHKKSAIDQLQGSWTLVAAVHDGVVLKKNLDSYHWTVTGDRLESFSGSGAVRTQAKIVISTDHNLQTIDFSAAMPDQSLPEWQTFNFAGIYRIERTAEGETLTVCFASKDSGFPRPSEFRSERRSRVSLITLTRAAKTLDAPSDAPKPPPVAEPRDKARADDPPKSVVAVIDGDTQLTREELADYLIRRYGADKLEVFVNLKIIETACARKGITVADAEIDAAIRADLKSLNITEGAFRSQYLKQYNKNWIEWREDVIRPRLMLGKLGGKRVTASNEDLRKAFENKCGPKVKCRIIVWPKSEEKAARESSERIRPDPVEFDRMARFQSTPSLAASGGSIDPIVRNAEDEAGQVIADAAFRLQHGEISELLSAGDRLAILKCDGHVPATEGKSFDSEKPALLKEVLDKKAAKEIPKLFNELKDAAKPKLFLQP